MRIHKYMPPNVTMESHKVNILDLIKEVGGVTTTSEIRSKLNVSWNTAEKRLLLLALEGKVSRIKKAGVNLWVLKK